MHNKKNPFRWHGKERREKSKLSIAQKEVAVYTIEKLNDKNYRLSVDEQSINLNMDDIASLLMILTDENILPNIKEKTRSTFDSRMKNWYSQGEEAAR